MQARPSLGLLVLLVRRTHMHAAVVLFLTAWTLPSATPMLSTRAETPVSASVAAAPPAAAGKGSGAARCDDGYTAAIMPLMTECLRTAKCPWQSVHGSRNRLFAFSAYLETRFGAATAPPNNRTSVVDGVDDELQSPDARFVLVMIMGQRTEPEPLWCLYPPAHDAHATHVTAAWRTTRAHPGRVVSSRAALKFLSAFVDCPLPGGGQTDEPPPERVALSTAPVSDLLRRHSMDEDAHVACAVGNLMPVNRRVRCLDLVAACAHDSFYYFICMPALWPISLQWQRTSEHTLLTQLRYSKLDLSTSMRN